MLQKIKSTPLGGFLCLIFIPCCLFFIYGCGETGGTHEQGGTHEEGGITDEVDAPVETAGTYAILVNFGDSTRLWQDLPYTPGMTVYTGMEAAQAANIGFSFQDSNFPGIGKFISTINGVEVNQDESLYWLYCIDDTTANLGVEEQPLASGEQLEWYYGEETPCVGVGE